MCPRIAMADPPSGPSPVTPDPPPSAGSAWDALRTVLSHTLAGERHLAPVTLPLYPYPSSAEPLPGRHLTVDQAYLQAPGTLHVMVRLDGAHPPPGSSLALTFERHILAEETIEGETIVLCTFCPPWTVPRVVADADPRHRFTLHPDLWPEVRFVLEEVAE